MSGDRWGDTRADRDALDRHLTTDPRDEPECPCGECDEPDVAETCAELEGWPHV